ncbi:MAG TPA: Inner-membrane translocator [Thermotogota bacterium]|nr:Inner-membrane translocator [Thermotogota bacterium]HRW92611.1 Inner-membrane translocator [Thermotogota bacterium]
MLAVLEQGLIMGLMAMGVFVSFRILNMPDLTVDGSFALGGAICVSFLLAGVPAAIALLLGALVGGGAGIVTALIHRKLKVNVLLAGILVMTMLYSVNLRIMNGPNLPIPRVVATSSLGSFEEEEGGDLLGGLFDDMDLPSGANERAKTPSSGPAKNIFHSDSGAGNLVLLSLILGATAVGLFVFLKTDLGTVMRGFGSNPDGVQAFGVSKTVLSVIGLAIANGLVGFSGGLFSLYGGFADVSMGQGMIVVGLAIVMMGEIVFGRKKPLLGVVAPVIGGVIYQGILALVMRYGYRIGFRASDMKLLTALFIVVMIALSLFRKPKAKLTVKKEVEKLWSNSKG